MLESNRCDIIYPTASAARPRTSHALNFHHFLLTLISSQKLFSELSTQQLERQHSPHSSWRDNTLLKPLPKNYKATKLQSYKATKLQSYKATKPLFTQQLESQHSSHSSWRDNTCVGILAYDHIRKKHKLSKNKEPFILLLSSTLLRINRLT